MQLKQLQYFSVLAKVQHCTKAAKKLYITQPSLSHSISELEKELGTQLFEKCGRNIHLNKYGRSFLPHVEKALAELQIGEKELLQLKNPSERKIHLGYPYNLGTHFIPKVISDFLNKVEHKNINFSFDQGSSKDLIDGIKQNKFDLIFCSYAENDPNIDFIPIAQEEFVLIVSKNHPLANVKSITLEEIAAYPLITFNKNSGLRPSITNILKDANISPKIIYEEALVTAVAGLVEINSGIAITPKIPALKDFNIKILKIKNLSYKQIIYIACIKNSYQIPLLKSFYSFIINLQNEKDVNMNLYL